MEQPHLGIVRRGQRCRPCNDSESRGREGHGAQNAFQAVLAGVHWPVGERTFHTHPQRNGRVVFADAGEAETGGKDAIGLSGAKGGLRTESGRFHSEILSDAAADQPGGAIGGPVNRRARVHRASLRLDMSRAAQIDRDGAEELTICRRLSSDNDVYRADLRFVRRDGPEDAVLGVCAVSGRRLECR